MVDRMLAFHAVIHARHANQPQGDIDDATWITIDGCRVSELPLDVARRAEPLGVRFEVAERALNDLERMFIEPDGSFVWVGLTEIGPWQVDGSLIDGRDGLVGVMIKGCCPPSALDRLLTCFGWPDRQFAFEMVERALVVDEKGFRQLSSPSET